MSVTVAERSEHGLTVVGVEGELDMDTAPALRSVLVDLVDRGVTRIVLDTERVRFCDSIGLSTLLMTHRACTDAGGFFRLAAPPPFLLRVLAAVGLATYLPTYRSVDAACLGDQDQRVAPTGMDDGPRQH
jgi:anti-anti-sigma factor